MPVFAFFANPATPRPDIAGENGVTDVGNRDGKQHKQRTLLRVRFATVWLPGSGINCIGADVNIGASALT